VEREPDSGDTPSQLVTGGGWTLTTGYRRAELAARARLALAATLVLLPAAGATWFVCDPGTAWPLTLGATIVVLLLLRRFLQLRADGPISEA